MGQKLRYVEMSKCNAKNECPSAWILLTNVQ